MNKSSFVLTFLMFCASCSKIEEMDKRTKNMEKSTREMQQTTAVMYQQMRSGEALKNRNEAYHILMDHNSSIRTKIFAGCTYMKGFEFQLWTDNQTFDNDYAKQIMYTDAVNEFTRRIGDLYDLINPKKISPANAGSKHNNEIAFYALALSLHINHHFQDELVRTKSHLQTNSLYDIIKTALLKEYHGENLEEYEEIMMSGQNKEVMIETIKARVDIISALALGNLTDKRDMTITDKSKGLIYKITGGALGSIDLPEVYEKSNKSTKNKTEEYLEGAVKTKAFLKSIGIEKPLEKTLRSAFKNIDFNENGSETDAKGITDDKKESIRKMINHLMD